MNTLVPLNTDVINRLTARNKKISLKRIVNILHRTIPVEELDPIDPDWVEKGLISGTPRGQVFGNDELCDIFSSRHQCGLFGTKESIFIFPYVALPSTFSSNKLLDILSGKHERIIESTKHDLQILNIAAFEIIFMSLIHAFYDGNGRVSLSLGKYIIDKYSDYTLDIDLLKRYNDEFMGIISQVYQYVCPLKYKTMVSFPEERGKFVSYIMNNLLHELELVSFIKEFTSLIDHQKKFSKSTISIIDPLLGDVDDLTVFLQDLTDNIAVFINEFSPDLTTGNENINNVIKQLVDFFRQHNIVQKKPSDQNI